eukprot:c40513_g1_i1 orf=3-242(-)
MDHHHEREVLKGVHALVQAGIQKVPACYVRPADELTSDPAHAARVGAVPIIDLSGLHDDEQRRASIVAQVAHACREWGFF